MKHVGDIAVIVLCAIVIGLIGAMVIAYAPVDTPESAVEAPVGVQAAKVDDEMAERLERVERVLERVERYLKQDDAQ